LGTLGRRFLKKAESKGKEKRGQKAPSEGRVVADSTDETHRGHVDFERKANLGKKNFKREGGAATRHLITAP